MLKALIISLVLILPSIATASEIQYRVNKSYYDVVAAVEKIINEPRERPIKIPNLPVLLGDKDIVVTTYVRPATRYYSVTIELNKPIGKLTRFDKKIEIFGQKSSYLIVSSVDIEYGRQSCLLINRIKDKIITNVEYTLLVAEKRQLLRYATKIEAAPEYAEPSWYYILTLILEKLL